MLLAALLLLSTFLLAKSDEQCPKGWQFVVESSSCVLITTQLFNADDANAYCKSLITNSSLAILSLQSEWAALTSLTSSQRLPPWMGATRTSNGAWKWNNGILVSSAYWGNNEPSIYGDCATLRSSGMAACPCYNLQPALCKMQPQLCNGGKFGGPNIQSGSINSPGYPIQYYNNLDCYYQIEGPPDTYITINFDPFFVENYLDYVEIYEGNTTSKLIGDLDTYMPTRTNFESTTNQMLVYFHTDSMITDNGWSAQWAANSTFDPLIHRKNSSST